MSFKDINSKILLIFTILATFLAISFVIADPSGPDSGTIVSNVTKNSTNQYEVNISGGYIATVNLSATIQNTRWKAFIGNVTGSFTLDNAAGSTIYDWSLASTTGEVFATRNATTITWTNINCSNLTTLEVENTLMNHTSATDNISATFNDTTHAEFTVASSTIVANTCPTLNTYNSTGRQDGDFEEIALYTPTGDNIVYAARLEENTVGYDGGQYDFQMIVPENGVAGFNGLTAYYLYVELD
jgi:hypothetical protein